MLNTINRWLKKQLEHDTFIQRQQAALFQVILLAALFISLVMTMVSVFTGYVTAVEQLVPYGLGGIAILAALGLVQRGYLTLSVTLIVLILFGVATHHVLVNGISGKSSYLSIFILPIALTALMLRRRWLVAGAIYSIVLVYIVAEAYEADIFPRGENIPELVELQTQLFFAVVISLLSFMLDRFNILLRNVIGDEQNQRIRLSFASATLTAQTEELQRQIAERMTAEEDLREINAELEDRVKARTKELETSSAQLQALIDGMGDGVFYSKNFVIEYSNHALAKMTGYSVEDLIGQPTRIFKSAHPTQMESDFFSQTMTVSGGVWRGEMNLRRKNGIEFPASLTVSFITDQNDYLPGMLTIVRDITRERELASQKSLFIANASHELRTPLANMKTRLYLLRHQGEKFDLHMGVLERVTNQMKLLVDDLLDVSRFERGVIELRHKQISLNKLIREVVETQEPEAAQKEINLSHTLPQEEITLYADGDRLNQVFVNLIINAIHYTDNKGTVQVKVHTNDNHPHPCAVITVQDTGTGISAADMERIFDPFFRAHEGTVQGTGLGLSIARSIIELHGGSLTVESQVNEGSTFTISFPLHLPPFLGDDQ